MSALRVDIVTIFAVLMFMEGLSAAPSWFQKHEQRKQQRDLKDTLYVDEKDSSYKEKSKELAHPMSIAVEPRVVAPNKYEAASVVCSATAGHRIEDLPFLAFYWVFHDDALVPITSSIPGVHVEPVDGGVDVYSQRLTIAYPLYTILQSGDNRFICTATNMSGQRVVEEFVIRKY